MSGNGSIRLLVQVLQKREKRETIKRIGLYIPYSLSLRSDPYAVGQRQSLVQNPGNVEGAAFPLDHEVRNRQSVADDGCRKKCDLLAQIYNLHQLFYLKFIKLLFFTGPFKSYTSSCYFPLLTVSQYLTRTVLSQ